MVVTAIGSRELILEPSGIDVGASTKEGEVKPHENGVEDYVRPLVGAMCQGHINQQQAEKRGQPAQQGCHRQDCVE